MPSIQHIQGIPKDPLYFTEPYHAMSFLLSVLYE